MVTLSHEWTNPMNDDELVVTGSLKHSSEQFRNYLFQYQNELRRRKSQLQDRAKCIAVPWQYREFCLEGAHFLGLPLIAHPGAYRPLVLTYHVRPSDGIQLDSQHVDDSCDHSGDSGRASSSGSDQASLIYDLTIRTHAHGTLEWIGSTSDRVQRVMRAFLDDKDVIEFKVVPR